MCSLSLKMIYFNHSNMINPPTSDNPTVTLQNIESNYDWYILPGRKVAHAFFLGHSRGTCGSTGSYPSVDLTPASSTTRRCEACLMTIVSGVSSTECALMGYVPHSIKRKRRRLWKNFLTRYPQYGPPSWRDKSIG